MDITIIIGIAAIVALMVILQAARAGHVGIVPANVEYSKLLTPIDVDALANLFDASETSYLRKSLSTREFCRVQKMRTRVAIAMLQTVAKNCSVLLHMAANSDKQTDAALVLAANQLSRDAVQLRLQAAFTIPQLQFAEILYSMNMPVAMPGLLTVRERYRTFSRGAVLYVSQVSPAKTSAFAQSL